MKRGNNAPSNEQRRAIEETEGACMVLAGPGSGKTYVLTHRIAHLLQKKGVYPWQILALTFTNKAAREMKERIEALIGEESRKLWIGTFHSIFARMLRIEAELIGLPRDFTIYDTEDSKKLIKKIVKELGLNEDMYKPNVVLNRISGAKNRFMMDAKGYKEDISCQEEDARAGRVDMGKLFSHYEARCRRSGALDFDDLLLSTYHMLIKHPEIVAKYQNRFHYLLVDEFQDTNKLQYALVRKLAALHGNLCVIGDDAQSIYAFRGAEVDHMLHFKKDFPEVKEIKLTCNFRSTQHIVKAANSLILHNKDQLKKVLFTDNPLGESIQLVSHKIDFEEALYVARDIFETSQRDKAIYSEFAILYRTNRQSRLLEESLRKLGVDYKVRGGTSFYARKEVKNLLAYLRLLVNDNDEQAFERIINTPKRGIGPATVAKVRGWALDQNISLWEALEGSSEVIGMRLFKAVEGFISLIKRYKEKLEIEDAYTIAKGVAEESGLLKALHNEKNIEDLGRYENVQELLSGIDSFVQEEGREDKSLSAYLQEISLMTGDEQEEENPYVTLMTMHAAKGLEYPYIYLVGLEEGILPSPLMTDSQKGIEEERRLFYVGITRAKRRLVLSHAFVRKQFESYKRVKESRFISEVDPSLLYRAAPSKRYDVHKSQTNPYPSQYRSAPKPSVSAPLKKSLKPLSSPRIPHISFQSRGGATKWEVNSKVSHPNFGEGTILEVGQTGHGERIKVDFPAVGTKTLLVAFAKLTML